MMDFYAKSAFKSLHRIKAAQSEIFSILDLLEDQMQELRDLYEDIDDKMDDFIDQSQDLMNQPIVEYDEYPY